MKLGTRFEKLTERIFTQLVKNPEYEKVEHNVKLDGKDGPRQIDVLVTSEVTGMTIKTIIECKDYKGRVSVGVVDSLHSVMEDVNANKGVLVSSNGFSSTAIKKAKRLGISIYTAHEALSEKWNIDIEIPILVREFKTSGFGITKKINAEKGMIIPKQEVSKINDRNIEDVVKEFWNSFKVIDLLKLEEKGNSLIPKNISEPFYIRDNNRNKIPVSVFRINFNLSIKMFFGYANEKKNTLFLRDIIKDQSKLIIDQECIFNYKKELIEVQKKEIPSFDKIEVGFLTKLNIADVEFTPPTISAIPIA